jgi:ADP-ribose pyrophosphatase
MINPFHVLGSEEVYHGRVVRVREDRVRLRDGSESIFTLAQVRHGASVIALDDENQLHLIREFKWAVQRASVEAPGGAIEDGESPIESARRELREEAGLEAADWTSLGTVHPFTSHVFSPVHLFLARGLRHIGTAHEPGEAIEPFRVPLATAVQMVMENEIQHAATVAGVLKTARLLGV